MEKGMLLEKLNTTVKTIIEDQMEQQGYTQVSLSKALGLHQSTVNKVLNSRRPITTNQILRFFYLLDLDLEELSYLAGREQMQYSLSQLDEKEFFNVPDNGGDLVGCIDMNI